MVFVPLQQLFLFLLEVQTGGAVAQQGCISAEQLLVELKAGGIRPEQEEAIKQELRHISSLDLVDFLAYRPLFVLIHNLAIANPLDDSSNLCCHWLNRLDPYLSLATTHCDNRVPFLKR